MKSRAISTVAAAAAVILAATVSSASDQFKITAPQGWEKQSSDNAGIIAYWVEPHPDGFRQNLKISQCRN